MAEKGIRAKIKSFFGVQDMTRGEPLHVLVRFSVPLLLGNFAQQLYSTVDSIIVGNNVEGGLAAIGSTMPIVNLLLVLFMAIATGAGIMVSQFFGAGDLKRLGKAIGNTLVLITLASLLMMGIAIPLARPMLHLLDTPPEIIGMAERYMQIIFIGILGSAYYNIVSGILRGLGDSFVPLLFLLFSTVLNTILDLVFVLRLDWGVSGAAFATIISQAVSAVFCLIRLYRMPKINKVKKEDLIPNFRMMRELMRLGIPAGITHGIFSLAMIMVQNLTNRMGTVVIEANTAVIRVDGFAMQPNFTFGMAATTYIGQNIGAREEERVVKGSKTISRLAFGVSLALTLLILLFGRQILSLFTSEQQVIQIGYRMMVILSVGYIAVSQTQVFGGIMRGAGDTMPAMWISLASTVGLRVPLAYFLCSVTRSAEWPAGSPYMLSVSLMASWVVGALLTWGWYRRGKWKDKRILPARESRIPEQSREG